MTGPTYQVCIIDDDEAIRESLRILLFAAGLSSCSFESADEFLESGQDVAFRCMLLDIRMPGRDGLELFHLLKKKPLAYPVIFITGHGDIPLAVSAIKQGAFDFLTKPFQDGELLSKIRSALEQFDELEERASATEILRVKLDLCTPREKDVMRHLVLGLSNKGVADALGISPRTVEIHRAHVMEKMEAESLPVLVRMVSRLEAEGMDI